MTELDDIRARLTALEDAARKTRENACEIIYVYAGHDPIGTARDVSCRTHGVMLYGGAPTSISMRPWHCPRAGQTKVTR